MKASMEERIARNVATAAVRSAREIGELVPALKDYSSEFDKRIKDAIGQSIYEIYENLLGPVLEEFPELNAKYQQNLEELDRLL